MPVRERLRLLREWWGWNYDLVMMGGGVLVMVVAVLFFGAWQ